MILTSSSEGPGRTGPGTPVSEPPADRVETLYSFVRARAFEGLHDAECSGDVAAWREQRQSILAIDTMFAQTQHGHPVVASCAITFFRARAMRHANHPEFRGEWLGVSAGMSKSA